MPTSKKTTASEIQEKLHKGIVTFTFRKLNNTVRTARGTLVQEQLELAGVTSTADYSSSPDVQVYFDLDKNNFRSFRIGREQEILDFKEL